MSKIVNFEPKTGVGRFDAEVSTGVMNVTIKLHLATALSDKEQRSFKDKFEQLVKQHWEGNYGFKNASTTVRPIFDIHYVDDMMKAHFVLNLRAGEGGSELVSRDIYYKVKNHDGFAPTSANLFTGSVKPTDSSADLVRDLRNSFPYYVDMSSGALSSHAETQLHMLIRQLKRADPNANLEVIAYGSNKTVNQQTMTSKLAAWGMQNTNVRSTKKWSSPKNPVTRTGEYVKLKIGNGLGVVDVSTQPLFSYPAAAVHEFGHMLGLLDEYACLSKTASDKMAELNFVDAKEQAFFEKFHPLSGTEPSETVSNAQSEFIQYCKAAHVDPPHYGQHTISIMSSGAKFLPCHYVTLWAALQEMNAKRDDDWAIVKLG